MNNFHKINCKFKGISWVNMVKIIIFLFFYFFAQKVFSGMEALCPKFLGVSDTRNLQNKEQKGSKLTFSFLCCKMIRIPRAITSYSNF